MGYPDFYNAVGLEWNGLEAVRYIVMYRETEERGRILVTFINAGEYWMVERIKTDNVEFWVKDIWVSVDGKEVRRLQEEDIEQELFFALNSKLL